MGPPGHEAHHKGPHREAAPAPPSMAHQNSHVGEQQLGYGWNQSQTDQKDNARFFRSSCESGRWYDA